MARINNIAHEAGTGLLTLDRKTVIEKGTWVHLCDPLLF